MLSSVPRARSITGNRLALGFGAALLVAAAASPAEATAITFQSTLSVTDTGSLVSYSSTGLNATLTVGVPDPIAQFITVTVSNGPLSDVADTVTADFTFTMPTPSGTTTDSGSITGQRTNGNGANGELTITWPNQPVQFDFTDGAELDVTLGDLDTSCLGNNCLTNDGPYYLSGSFDVIQGPTGVIGGQGTPVPEPATLSVFAFGVLGLAAFLRRRNPSA